MENGRTRAVHSKLSSSPKEKKEKKKAVCVISPAESEERRERREIYKYMMYEVHLCVLRSLKSKGGVLPPPGPLSRRTRSNNYIRWYKRSDEIKSTE